MAMPSAYADPDVLGSPQGITRSGRSMVSPGAAHTPGGGAPRTPPPDNGRAISTA
jgi:hypothetical protein